MCALSSLIGKDISRNSALKPYYKKAMSWFRFLSKAFKLQEVIVWQNKDGRSSVIHDIFGIFFGLSESCRQSRRDR